MTSAYILVAAILVLGGIIAALGDNLGSKVGKAKLRLFNLRPRQTAVVLTVLTGILISASTLGILFSFSKSLREGIFKLDDILKQLRQAQSELQQAAVEKDDIEKRLKAAKTKQVEVQKLSKEINANYNRALAKLKQTSADAKRLQNDVQDLLHEREQIVRQKQQLVMEMNKLQAQVKLRDQELSKRQQKIAEQDKILFQRQERLQSLEKRFKTLEAQRQQLQTDINQRDAHIDQLDQAIALQDRNIKLRENKLKNLENELSFLNREVQVLEQYYQNYQDLRERKIALLRGQVLAFGAVRIMNPNAINQAVDELLRQANKVALQATRPANQPAPSEPIVKITKAQVDQLSEQLKDGQDYVIRIISAGNYVQGENDIRVFADVAPNKLIFKEDENIATISMESSNFTEEDIQKRLDYLLSAAQFRARREGVLGSIQVEDGRIKTLIKFIEDISGTSQRPDEIRVVATDDTFTVGPLKLRLIALKNGEIIFGT
ncbi:MAG: DUF3084 domain-containing protein [Snowella sp.]|nr:DUF3084 domain-containing protein [Snowella sp.]